MEKDTNVSMLYDEETISIYGRKPEEMIKNPFLTYRDSVIIKEQIKSRHILAGDYSYYAGYYHG